jgi:Undecaprenyl-phosphate glucose phosphotransferase
MSLESSQGKMDLGRSLAAEKLHNRDLRSDPARLLFMTIDVIMLFLGTVAFQQFIMVLDDDRDFPNYTTIIAVVAPVFCFLAEILNVYSRRTLYHPLTQFLQTTAVLVVSTTLVVAVGFAFQASPDRTIPWMSGWLINVIALLSIWRLLLLTAVGLGGVQSIFCRHAVVVGPPDAVGRSVVHLKTLPETEIRLLGFFTADIPGDYHGRLPFCGGFDNIAPWCRFRGVDLIVAVIPGTDSDGIRCLLTAVEGLAIDVRLVGSASDMPELADRPLTRIGDLCAIRVQDRPIRGWGAVAKRALDLLGAGALILALAPLLLLIAAAVALESPGGILFRQRRFGFQNEEINVFKFRSMYVDRQDISGAQRTTRGDPRVTKLGRLLRRTSLDELPQLFNVIAGDMSLVGPRPHATAMKVGDRLYHDAVPQYAARHRVRPGITGWAQVNGLRGEIADLDVAKRRVEFDLYYIENWSLRLDIKILLKTVGCVFGDHNAY